MFCSNCGTQIPDGSAFCPKCGKNLSGETKAPQNNSTPAAAPAPAPAYNSAPSATAEGKSKMAAGLLGIFLGTLGIHNFYLGYTGKAIVQLLLGTVGAFIIIGPVISGIWGFVEGILILTGKISVDGKGVPLK